MANIGTSLQLVPGAPAEIFAEVLEGARNRERGHTPEATQRALQHRLTQVFQELQIMLRVDPRQYAVDHLYATGRADPARGALPAGLDGAELHGITCHFGHVDGVVEGHDAPVT